MKSEQYKNGLQQPRFGELLCDSGVITHEQLNQGLLLQERLGGRIGEALSALGYLSTNSLVSTLQKKHQVRAIDLAQLEILPHALGILPLELMEQHKAIPLEVTEQGVYLAMTDPGDLEAIKEIESLLGRTVHPVAAPSAQVRALLRALQEMGGPGDRPVRVRDLCELQAPGPLRQKPQPPDLPTLEELCRRLVVERATDLLLCEGAPPSLKKFGALIRLPYPPLDAERLAGFARTLMTAAQGEEFRRLRELDFSCRLPQSGRFRVNAYLQRGSVALSLRATTDRIPTLEELGLPDWLAGYALKPYGLILVSAATGQGKSSTLAALVDQVNSHKRANIITIEDPIEFLHHHKQSNVTQREVGVDTDSFHEGLKRVFRQAPDVIVIGEIRDPESAAIAIQAAGSGHLVISTVHASTTTTALERLIDIFPPSQQQQIRSQLAESLLLVLGQRLLPTCDGKGQALAWEKLVNSQRVRTLVREGKTHLIRSFMQQGTDDFCSFDSHLAQLCRDGVVAPEEAARHCDNAAFLQDALGRAGVAG